MVFRFRPPRPPSGGKVIPFPTRKERPTGLRSLGESPPAKVIDFPVQEKEPDFGMTPFPELPTKTEEPPKKFKGVHKAIKDLSESMEKFNERHDFLLEREGLSGLKEEIPAKTNTDKYIRERITNPDQPKLAGDELQKEIMKFTEGHSGNEDIISVLQRQLDDIKNIGLPTNEPRELYIKTVTKDGRKILTINRRTDGQIMGVVYPSTKGDTMILQTSPTIKRKSLERWTPIEKTEGDYDLVTAQGKPITRRESGFQNVGEVTVTDPKKRGRSVMEGLRVILNYMEHELQYYYDKSQGLNPTWTDPKLNK